MFDEALKTKNGELAIKLLELRNSREYEYETFEIIDPITID